MEVDLAAHGAITSGLVVVNTCSPGAGLSDGTREKLMNAYGETANQKAAAASCRRRLLDEHVHAIGVALRCMGTRSIPVTPSCSNATGIPSTLTSRGAGRQYPTKFPDARIVTDACTSRKRMWIVADRTAPPPLSSGGAAAGTGDSIVQATSGTLAGGSLGLAASDGTEAGGVGGSVTISAGDGTDGIGGGVTLSAGFGSSVTGGKTFLYAGGGSGTGGALTMADMVDVES